MDDLPIWLQSLLALLLLVGGGFTLVGALGLLRFPDFYMRLHAPTKATTLGVGGVLLAGLVLGWWHGDPGVHALLITGFLFLTAPVSANLMAQAAMHLRLPSRSGQPPVATGDAGDTSDAAGRVR